MVGMQEKSLWSSAGENHLLNNQQKTCRSYSVMTITVTFAVPYMPSVNYLVPYYATVADSLHFVME